MSAFRGQEVPLVGRIVELNTLRQALMALYQGQGGGVLILGAAGLGKSRLIAEGQAFGHEWDLSWVSVTGQLMGAVIGYGPIRHLLRRLLDIGLEIDQATARTILEQRVAEEVSQEQETTVMGLARLLGLPLRGDEIERFALLNPEQQQELAFTASRSLLRAISRRRPVVLAVDDLHWVDSASLEWLTRMMSLAAEAPILFLLASRPVFSPAVDRLVQQAQYDLGDRFVKITLQPLSLAEACQLAGYLTADNTWPFETLALVAHRSEGNPFYIEELVRVLREREADHLPPAREDIPPLKGLPEDVREVLSRRIRKLDRHVRRVLQMAAVIGVSFSPRLLKEMAVREEHLAASLAALEQAGLLVQRQEKAEDLYTFRHTLIREAAYRSLRWEARRRYHRRLALGLESLLAGHLDENCGLIAYHYYQGGEWEQALRYAVRAARLAEEIYANETALEHYQVALDSLDHLPETQDNQEQRFQILYACADIYMRLGHWEQARRHLLSLDEVAQRLARPSYRAETHLSWARLYTRLSEWMLAEEHARQAVTLLREIEGKEALARALNSLGGVLWYQGQRQQALLCYQESLTLCRQTGDQAQMGRTLSNLAVLYQELGEHQLALRCLEQALDIARAQGDRRLEWIALNNLAVIHMDLGEYRESLHCCQAVEELCRLTGDKRGLSSTLGNLGLTYRGLGDAEAALAAYQRSMALDRELKNLGGAANTLREIGHLHCELGLFEQGLREIEAALQEHRSLGNRTEEGYDLIGLAYAYRCLGQYEQALNHARKAAAIHMELENDYGLSRAWLEQGLAEAELGEYDQAIRTLEQAAFVAAELRPLPDRVDVENALSTVYRLRGRKENLELALEHAHRAYRMQVSMTSRHSYIAARLNQALAYLALGQVQTARRCSQEAVALLEQQGWFAGSEEEVYLGHWRVLRAAGEAEADHWRQRAETLVQGRAAAITDVTLRRSYLAQFVGQVGNWQPNG